MPFSDTPLSYIKPPFIISDSVFYSQEQMPIQQKNVVVIISLLINQSVSNKQL